MKLIPWAKPKITIQDRKILNNALRSEWISHGSYVEKFEPDPYSSWTHIPPNLSAWCSHFANQQHRSWPIVLPRQPEDPPPHCPHSLSCQVQLLVVAVAVGPQ